jgi:hypothetical protein
VIASPLTQAAVPTARTIRWTPLAGVAGLLLVVLVLARASERPGDVLLAVASAALASVVVGALHDPASTLLAALPVSSMQRRVLRLALVGLPTLTLWWVLTLVADSSPGTGGPGPFLALAASGVAVAVWAPPHVGVLLGALVPGLWFALDTSVPWTGAAAGIAGGWRTEPWIVVAAAILVLVAGRRR